MGEPIKKSCEYKIKVDVKIFLFRWIRRILYPDQVWNQTKRVCVMIHLGPRSMVLGHHCTLKWMLQHWDQKWIPIQYALSQFQRLMWSLWHPNNVRYYVVMVMSQQVRSISKKGHQIASKKGIKLSQNRVFIYVFKTSKDHIKLLRNIINSLVTIVGQLVHLRRMLVSHDIWDSI